VQSKRKTRDTSRINLHFSFPPVLPFSGFAIIQQKSFSKIREVSLYFPRTGQSEWFSILVQGSGKHGTAIKVVPIPRRGRPGHAPESRHLPPLHVRPQMFFSSSLSGTTMGSPQRTRTPPSGFGIKNRSQLSSTHARSAEI